MSGDVKKKLEKKVKINPSVIGKSSKKIAPVVIG